MQTAVMPKLGDTMEEGKILRWLKQEGDTVQRGDALAEIETEKVNIEAEAFASGILRKILVGAEQTVPVGAPIALIGEANEPLPGEASAAPASSAPAAPTRAPASSAPDTLPQEVIRAIAAEEHTQEQEPVAAAPGAFAAPPSPTASVAVPVAPSVAGNGHAPQHVIPAQGSPETANGRTFISPIARRIAAEHNLDIAQISGTGPGGRIIRDDVQAALAQQQQQQVTPAAALPSAAPASAPGEEVEVVPLSMMRRTIARRLQQSMQTAPHFYVTVAIETTALAALRASINAYAEHQPQPVKVSLNDLIVRGVALALAGMPQVNVSFDGDKLLYKKHINVGVAVALDQGLIVPVIRDADKRGVLEIARESRRLAEAARAGKLKPEEFQGGTFTVSNLGMFDVEEFTAVINPPESAILAVGASVATPVVVGGQIVVRDRMKVTLSSDHRALDGAVAARFLQQLKHLLEEPMALLV